MPTDKFTITAKLEEEDTKSSDREERQRGLREALQNLLETRFQLQTHRESKIMACFALVAAKGGSKLQESKEDKGGNWNSSPGILSATRMPMENLASFLSGVMERPVKDMTGFKPAYDLKLEWTPENPGGERKPETSTAPSIFTALQEQLGLKLETAKAPIEMLVIDRAEKPAEN